MDPVAEIPLSCRLGANFCPTRVVILCAGDGGGASIARVRRSATDSSVAVATVARASGRSQEEQLQSLVGQLPTGCSEAALLTMGRRGQAAGAAGSDNGRELLLGALADRSIKVMELDAESQLLRGLAHCWFSRGQSSQEMEQRFWHEELPACNQLVTHSPSWRSINERLAKRILRHEGASGDEARAPTIVAELGPHELSIHKIDSSLTVSCLARESLLGYRNLMGLARLSTLPCPAASLGELLELAAQGSMGKLDLTIGDLLPAESVYGLFDLATNVFSLGKLHDFKTLDELQPSPSDVAASLTYVFIKTFFDAIVHAASAHGIPRVLVTGEFFQSEACRRRLLEVWNFTGMSKEALRFHFLRDDCRDSLALVGSLLAS